MTKRSRFHSTVSIDDKVQDAEKVAKADLLYNLQQQFQQKITDIDTKLLENIDELNSINLFAKG